MPDKAHANEINIEVLSGQFKLLKWLVGIVLPIFGAFVLTLGGWVWKESTAVAQLKTDIAFQQKTLDRQEKWIQQNTGDVRQVTKDLATIKADTRNIKDMVSRLVTWLDSSHSREKM